MSRNANDSDDAILARLSAGEDVTEEVNEIRDSLVSKLEERYLLSLCRSELKGYSVREPQIELTTLRAQISKAESIKAAEPSTFPIPVAGRAGSNSQDAQPKNINWNRSAVAKYAMAFGLCVAAGFSYLLSNDRKGETQVHEYSTHEAQYSTVRLPDGSTALLAPESRMRYTASFGKNTRVIDLDGEALFTVTQSAGAPFIVRSGNVAAQVLGTSFSVRRYPTESEIRVVVAEGKVSVSHEQTSTATVVTTGEAIRVTRNGVIVSQQQVNVSNALAWTQERLEFVKVPLRDVLIDLKRMYGLNVRAASAELGNQLVTGSIDRTTADSVVRMLALTLGAHAERQGSTILLSE